MISGTITSLRHRILDRLVLRPSRHDVDPGDQERQMLTWGSAGEPLECFVQRRGEIAQPLDWLVVKFPGTAGRAERSSDFPTQYFDHINSEIWTWNPPGYGRSGGRASLKRIEKAALAFWRQMLGSSRFNANTRIWVCGNSLGCVPALRVACGVDPQGRMGMVLRNPPPLTHVVKAVASKYPFGRMIHPVADSLHDSMNAILTARRVSWPAVFLQSELDELVLPRMQNEVVDAYQGPHQQVIMEGLTHGAIATDLHEPLIRQSLNWLWEHTDGNR